MITAWFASKKEKPKYYQPLILGSPTNNNSLPDYKYAALAGRLNITATEARRRDDIVRSAWMNCRLFIGQEVELVRDDLRKKYDYKHMKIIGIAKNLDEYGTVEWHEPPFIINIQSDKGTFACTASYVQPVLGGNKGASC